MADAVTINWIEHGPGAVERIEASFCGVAFSPHRHDTYAIGVTLAGVQSFDYRGATRHSLPGDLVVLHPDEIHDGHAGTDDGFRYRAIYIEPAMLQQILGGGSLPFVEGGISSDDGLSRAVLALLDDFQRALDPLEYQGALFDLAHALAAISGGPPRRGPSCWQAAERAREILHARLVEGVTLEELEALTGHDRWALSRDFRALFGTSPYRYLTLRRLDRARDMIRSGHTLTDAAYACSFSDQSHFCRQFKKAFGLTPKKWAQIRVSAIQ